VKECKNLIYLDEHINLLDMTRIPEEWYPFIMKKMSETGKVLTLGEMVNIH
jgi:hypothetical protein